MDLGAVLNQPQSKTMSVQKCHWGVGEECQVRLWVPWHTCANDGNCIVCIRDEGSDDSMTDTTSSLRDASASWIRLPVSLSPDKWDGKRWTDTQENIRNLWFYCCKAKKLLWKNSESAEYKMWILFIPLFKFLHLFHPPALYKELEVCLWVVWEKFLNTPFDNGLIFLWTTWHYVLHCYSIWLCLENNVCLVVVSGFALWDLFTG